MADLSPTTFIDSDHPEIRAYAERVTEGATGEREIVSRLFAAVRDDIRYDPFRMSVDAQDYRASAVLAGGPTYCVPKSVLLAAVARASGIPARIGLADVRNHLQSERLREAMQTDVFIYHGYTALFVEGEWRKASSAFNRELCERFGVPPLEFDGTADALLHAFDAEGGKYMEYLTDHGTFADLPFDDLIARYRSFYPRGLVP
jgi:transglutaminase-like putative cysteine protease